MSRLFASLALVALVAAVGAAQPPSHVIQLTVSATPAPTPALKYELLPRMRDRVPGNGALDYHRAYMLRPTWPRDPKESKAQDDMVIAWEEMPVEKLPVEDVRKFLASYKNTFRSLERGAWCERCDWEFARTLREQNYSAVLPEVQAQRELTRFLRLRIRADLAENKFDDAAVGLQTGFRLAKDVGEGPSMIHMLVGIALASIFEGSVESFVSRPVAPNLYWALTVLPRPFIEPRAALEGESILFHSMFPDLKELEAGPVSADRANVALEDTFRMLRRLADEPAGPAGDPFGKVGLAGYVALQAPAARKQLIELGRPAAEVEKMPPAQAVLLRGAAVIRLLSDDQVKCFSLPYPQATKELAAVRLRANQLGKANDTDVFIRLFLMTLPATEKVYEAHSRIGRRLAGLRAVEGIRLHSAGNNGMPPKTLAECIVPIPDDPYTGKPFAYTVDGNTLALDAPPTNGEPAHVGNSFRYEVTIRK
jgi:hypothetical protein